MVIYRAWSSMAEYLGCLFWLALLTLVLACADTCARLLLRAAGVV